MPPRGPLVWCSKDLLNTDKRYRVGDDDEVRQLREETWPQTSSSQWSHGAVYGPVDLVEALSVPRSRGRNTGTYVDTFLCSVHTYPGYLSRIII